uniref:Uncharacterized protein n=1 Tax=Arion vulgaris TaxID=1028688 RepID=A0A0B7ARI7_9EUPU
MTWQVQTGQSVQRSGKSYEAAPWTLKRLNFVLRTNLRIYHETYIISSLLYVEEYCQEEIKTLLDNGPISLS